MIKKLKRKFIVLATVCVLIFMIILVGGMNLINYSAVVKEADETLGFLSTGSFEFNRDFPKKDNADMAFDKLPRGMSPEVPYESRFFTVTMSNDGEIVLSDTTQIISVGEESVTQYADKAFESGKDEGFVDNFRYLKTTDTNGTKITFLDCGRKLDTFNKFFEISSLIALCGFIAVFLFFIFAAEKIVRPIAKAYEKQKRFITDAGHEIKTPLTVIGANTDLLEADFGENESTSDIKQQVAKLRKLTDDLVYLSKLEESESSGIKVSFPVSDIVSESVMSFKGVALSGNIDYRFNIEPSLSLYGSPDRMERLLLIVLENAFKYVPDGGQVFVDFHSKGKNIYLSVFNTTENEISPNEIKNVFERFYRTDKSRNSQTGGHGIGLSVARAIAESFNGKIYAETQKGFDFKIFAIFPKN